MSEDTIDPSQQFAAQIRSSLIKGFIIPLLLLAFYAAAPRWLNHNLHEWVTKNINGSTQLKPAEKAERIAEFSRIDFAEVCGAPIDGLERLKADLESNGVCGQFKRLQWGLWLSELL